MDRNGLYRFHDENGNFAPIRALLNNGSAKYCWEHISEEERNQYKSYESFKRSYNMLIAIATIIAFAIGIGVFFVAYSLLLKYVLI